MLHFKEDLVNFIRGISAPIIFFYPVYAGFPEGYTVLTVCVLWLILNDINHVLHLHIHHTFSKSNTNNIILDICMGVVTGMTASNWRIQHIFGHHMGPRGEYGPGYKWEMERYSILGAISFSFRTIWPIFYKPILESYRKGIINNTKHPINYRWAFIEQVLLIILIIVLLGLSPLLTISYVIPWYCLVYFVTRYTDYLNHFGCLNTPTGVTNNCTNKIYNLLGCNFGFHTAHHSRPMAHWTTLPAIHKSISATIPADKIKAYSWSGFMIPYHFYLSARGKM